MILDRKQWILLMCQSLDRMIIQVQVRDLGPILQRVHVYAKSVVLGGDLYLAGCQIHHRMVAAPVAEFELVSPSPQGQPHDLVTETDAKHRHPADQHSDIFLGVGHGIRITRAVREEHAVRLKG